jgi:predicted ATPase
MKKLNVRICKSDKYAVSEWNVKDWYQNLLRTGDEAIVATSNQLNELRVGVVTKEIEPFSFLFGGKYINVTSDGKLSEWPDGFMDHQKKQMFCIMSKCTRSESENIPEYITSKK